MAQESEALISYRNGLSDYKIYAKHVLQEAEKLDDLYQSIADESVAEKQAKEEAFMEAFVTSLQDLPLSEGSFYKKLFREKRPDNNYFISYRRYREQQSIFADQLQEHAGGDVKTYISWLKTKYESL